MPHDHPHPHDHAHAHPEGFDPHAPAPDFGDERSRWYEVASDVMRDMLIEQNVFSAREVRKLLAEHLPGLVDSYTRIPSSLRGREHAGSTPAAQVTEGLSVIAGEIETMSQNLSRNDLDALAVRGRFLESKYVSPPPEDS
jgi:hypothetical protein